MIEEYKGIYFQNRNSNKYHHPQKKFYEHGAHFEYSALYLILEKISKKIKPNFNSSIPKRKNISLNKKRASSCKRKLNKQNNIKFNLSYFHLNKNKINNKKILNNSLIIKEKVMKNLSCGKNKNNNSFNNKYKHMKNSKNKNHYKYNSSIINNSMEVFYNENKFNLNESLNSNHKEKDNKFNHIYLNKLDKKNIKFNAYVLSDFSKKNDNIIFSYNKKLKKDNSEFLNKNKYLTENKNLITKENKNESITIEPINLSGQKSKEKKYLIKNKINITDINNIKSTTYKNLNNKNKIKEGFDNSFLIKTPKYNIPKKIEKNKKFLNNKSKNKQIKQNLNKISIREKEYLKLEKSTKNQGKPKIKISRNNENIKSANSVYDTEIKNQSSFHNFKYNNLIINNETEKINPNINNSDLIKEKEDNKNNKKYYQTQNNNSIEKRDKKNYIKNKLLEQNRLNLDSKDKINISKTNNILKKLEKNNKKEIKQINNYCYDKKDNNIFSSSTKSNNDSIKSKSNKNGDKKSIISTNLTSHINSRGMIIPLHRKKIDFNNQ